MIIEPWMICLAIAALWMLIGLGTAAFMDWRDLPDEVLELVAQEMERP